MQKGIEESKAKAPTFGEQLIEGEKRNQVTASTDFLSKVDFCSFVAFAECMSGNLVLVKHYKRTAS